MKRNIFPRLFITLIGAAFILWGICSILLGVIGERATAVVTDIRREGGERTDVLPGRYTYSIGYTFILPDGREIDGSAKKIGDGVYMKADGSSTVPIRYFLNFPYVNAMEKDTGMRTGPLILIFFGGILVFLTIYKYDNL